MSKIMLLFLGAIVAVMIMSGIVEVDFNPEKYTDIPDIANTIVAEKSTYEKGRSYVVNLKRKGELVVVRDKEKRLVLSLLYVKTDAERLREMTAKNLNAASLLPQAELLVWSIEQVRVNAEKAPVEVVAGMKNESVRSFSLAQQALSGLQNQYNEYEEIHTEFSRLTRSLEQQIGQLGLEDSVPKQDVAGAQDTENQQTNTGDTASPLPLKF